MDSDEDVLNRDKFDDHRNNDNCFHDEEEKEHFQSILVAFQHYKSYTLQKISKREKFIQALPLRHISRLGAYQTSLGLMRKAAEANSRIISLITQDVESIFHNVPSEQVLPAQRPPQARAPHGGDIEKVQSVLKQIVRDWSSEGALERQQCYQPLLTLIQQEFPDPHGVSVLVPGAGLGRLAYEIAILGYICQGNEFSLFMLFASNFVLNKCHEVNKYKIYPWLHQFVNNLSSGGQLHAVAFPDTSPGALEGHSFSMVAGDFTKVYTTEAEWDCVATCFFIDCAPNVIDFIETIFLILRPGGLWINLGPLLYHYTDLDNENSIEPPYDVLCHIIKDVGFIIEKSETGVKTKYSQNPNSMLQCEYESILLVCRKPK